MKLMASVGVIAAALFAYLLLDDDRTPPASSVGEAEDPTVVDGASLVADDGDLPGLHGLGQTEPDKPDSPSATSKQPGKAAAAIPPFAMAVLPDLPIGHHLHR